MIENNIELYEIEDASDVDVSIIIPCKNEVNNIKWTIDSLLESKNHLKCEIVVIDDASTDGSTDFLKSYISEDKYRDIILINTNNIGAAAARNMGAKVAKGKYLFFFDAHVKVPDMWADNLINTLEKSKASLVAPCIADITNISSSGYGLTWNDEFKVTWFSKKPKEGDEIPLAGGAALGITREAFDKIGGFDHLFQVWGREDEEICLKAWLYGYRIVINPDVIVQHLFRKSHPYKVTVANVTYNTICLACSHFEMGRLKKVMDIAKRDYYYFDAASEINKNSGLIVSQRNKYAIERIYDDEYFFNKFNVLF
ncbi:glycosyltransferase family 2 protein [Clostridium sp. CF012]|uniref:glycosyltransferase family 2 protein n=1 Tax=Clostridium sp. CF012 TaxID=2843319 RepID=UPI001C0D1A02|nr:glycosyltransferase [Clostridium sp. CF012]MBU3143983.1 glycosyltransferase [Clostridium sp. CF012]